jgi:hypothetical protein
MKAGLKWSKHNAEIYFLLSETLQFVPEAETVPSAV